jgi:hypothetical protein
VRSPRVLALAVITLALALAASASLLAQGPPPQGLPPRVGPAPGDGPGPPPDRFPLALALRALDERASLLLEQGKTDAALVEMRRAFTLDVPRKSPVYELKAQLIGRFALTLANTGRGR